MGTGSSASSAWNSGGKKRKKTRQLASLQLQLHVIIYHFLISDLCILYLQEVLIILDI